MKYYLIPKEEKDLDILSENWCVGGDLENNNFFKGKGWKIYKELFDKSNDQINLLKFYCIKNNFGKVINWNSFDKILKSKTILK